VIQAQVTGTGRFSAEKGIGTHIFVSVILYLEDRGEDPSVIHGQSPCQGLLRHPLPSFLKLIAFRGWLYVHRQIEINPFSVFDRKLQKLTFRIPVSG